MKLALPQRKKPLIVGAIIVAAGAFAFLIAANRSGEKNDAGAVKPALSVSTETPRSMRIARRLAANGNVEAWQEAVIGANVSGLVLAEVRVNVGDTVKKGQVLAVFANQTVAADLEQARAHAAELEASAREAEANAARAQKVADSGALSAQQLAQYATSADTARARAKAQVAAVRAQEVRLADTRIVAPDDGVISARSATVGAVPAGPELFRLIRQGRLEWRAEVPATQMLLLKPGMVAHVNAGAGITVDGKVRMLAPSVDPKTRNGIVYVDLPKPDGLRAGMFAAGDFEVGMSDSLTLPQSAVMVRDGYSFVFRIGTDNKVMQTKIEPGRRFDERVEILGGLNADDRVVVAGGGFLNDGDLVRVVPATASANPTASSNVPAAAAQK